MDPPDQIIRRGRDDRAGGVRPSILIEPAVEQPGEREDRPVFQAEEEGVARLSPPSAIR